MLEPPELLEAPAFLSVIRERVTPQGNEAKRQVSFSHEIHRLKTCPLKTDDFPLIFLQREFKVLYNFGLSHQGR
jgi:hypothetical protein